MNFPARPFMPALEANGVRSFIHARASGNTNRNLLGDSCKKSFMFDSQAKTNHVQCPLSFRVLLCFFSVTCKDRCFLIWDGLLVICNSISEASSTLKAKNMKNKKTCCSLLLGCNAVTEKGAPITDKEDPSKLHGGLM